MDKEDTRNSKQEDRRTKRTKTAIKNAFFEIARKKEIEKISVTEITKLADINRKTFYCHYDSLEDMIDEIVRDDAEQLAAEVRATMFTKDKQLDVVGLYRDLSSYISCHLENDASLISHITFSSWIKTVERVYVEEISENKLLFEDGFSKDQAYFLVIFLVSGLFATLKTWIKEDSDVDLQSLSESVSSAVVGALEGIEQYRLLSTEE